jgi:hypothetical protein
VIKIKEGFRAIQTKREKVTTMVKASKEQVVLQEIETIGWLLT